MSVAELIHPKEKSIKPIVYILSTLVWALVILSIVGALYGLMLVPFLLMAQAYLLGAMRASGVRVNQNQLPEIHERVVRISQKLGMDRPPEVYVVQSGGVLNAFATSLFSRRYVILYSNLIDQCGSEKELDFVIAHEVMHHAAGHLKMRFFTLPARIVPLLGTAYSRACEYTCDRAALFAVQELEPSQRALAILAGGSHIGLKLDLRAFEQQQDNTNEFWPAVYEIGSSHPYLSKRVAMLGRWQQERQGLSATVAPAPRRPLLAYLFGMFVGGQAAVWIFVFYLGLLSAIAVPNFKKFQERARNQAAGMQPLPTQVEVLEPPKEVVEPEATPEDEGD